MILLMEDMTSQPKSCVKEDFFHGHNRYGWSLKLSRRRSKSKNEELFSQYYRFEFRRFEATKTQRISRVPLESSVPVHLA